MFAVVLLLFLNIQIIFAFLEEPFIQNPARLRLMNDWDIDFLNLSILVNKDMKENIEGMNKLSKSLQNDSSETKIMSTIQKDIFNFTGEKNTIGFGINPMLLTKSFGLSISSMNTAGFIVHNPSYKLMHIEAQSESEIRIGFATSILEDKLHLGASFFAKNIALIYADLKISDIAYISDSGDDLLEEALLLGSGFGMDLGLIFTPKIPFDPQIGIALKNVGDVKFNKLKFKKLSVKRAPFDIPQQLDIDFEFLPFPFLGAFLGMQAVNLPGDPSRKIYSGVATGIPNWISLATGIYNKSWAFAFEFDITVFKLGYMTYQNSLNDYQDDRHHLISLNVLF